MNGNGTGAAPPGRRHERRTGPGRTGFREVFASGEFRVLWLAQAQSRIGDQLARVALALLVFDRTSSAAMTALVYALTFLPPLLTAPLLAGLADRYSRRTVMVAVDLIRAVVIALMAVPSLPLPVLMVLVTLATCPQPLFSAARNATLPQVLPDGRFAVGMSVITATDGLAQIAGFTVGGLLVAATGDPHLVLALNAGTFALSAGLLRWGIGPHRPEPSDETGRGGFALAGVRHVLRDRTLLGLASLMWIFGCFVVPEALAVPYAAEIGAGEEAVGFLMAGDVIGMAVGAVAFAKTGVRWRRRLLVPLAAATGLPLMATALTPGVPATVALWAAAGFLGTYMVIAQIAFTGLVPDHMRARAIAFASAGLQTAQGLGVLFGGLLAEALPPSSAIAVSAAVGTAAALTVGIAARLGRVDHEAPEPAAPVRS
ncbi:MFS transporter [Glycomyces sp. MUSA5-2]|uniref:MFS transporter n=1 Tax=Glycomyces sp. MUSA5-2 TaxID=2053002 RepID=UPI00300982B4